MDNVRLTVAVCTYNRANLLRDTLSSFRDQEGLDTITYEVLVVDNNSTDDTKHVVREFESWPNLRYVAEEKQGLSHARNRAVEESRGEIVAFTDDDVLFSPRWALEMLAGVERYPEADIFGGKAPAKWEKTKPDWFVEEGDYSMLSVVGHYDPDIEEGITDVPPFGCNMAFSAEAIRGSGGFSPDYGRLDKYLGAGEETELIERLWAQGRKAAYLPHAWVHHRVHDARYEKSYYQFWFACWQQTQVRVLWKKQGRPRSIWQLLWRDKYYARWMIRSALSWCWLLVTCRWSAQFSRRLRMLCCGVQLGSEFRALLGRE